MAKFTTENKSFKEIPTRRFLNWVSSYAEFKGYEFKKDKDHMGRYFELIAEKDDTKDDINDDIPF